MLKQRVKDKIDQMTPQQLINISRQVGEEITLEDLGTPIWVKIKDTLNNVKNERSAREFFMPEIQKLVKNVDKVKVVLDDGWYVNPELNIRLKPEWVILTETME